MPIDINDSDNGLGVVVIGSGILTDNEYLATYIEHLSQGEDKYQKYKYGLHDWTAVTSVEISNDAIAQIAYRCMDAAKINPDLVTAHVADKDITFGLSRMWELMSAETQWDIMVFRDREKAEAWIRQKIKEKARISDLTFG
jgi:hypothetical protein